MFTRSLSDYPGLILYFVVFSGVWSNSALHDEPKQVVNVAKCALRSGRRLFQNIYYSLWTQICNISPYICCQVNTGEFLKWLETHRMVFFRRTELYHCFLLCTEILDFVACKSTGNTTYILIIIQRYFKGFVDPFTLLINYSNSNTAVLLNHTTVKYLN